MRLKGCPTAYLSRSLLPLFLPPGAPHSPPLPGISHRHRDAGRGLRRLPFLGSPSLLVAGHGVLVGGSEGTHRKHASLPPGSISPRSPLPVPSPNSSLPSCVILSKSLLLLLLTYPSVKGDKTMFSESSRSHALPSHPFQVLGLSPARPDCLQLSFPCGTKVLYAGSGKEARPASLPDSISPQESQCPSPPLPCPMI